jgi:hypothetical protein
MFAEQGFRLPLEPVQGLVYFVFHHGRGSSAKSRVVSCRRHGNSRQFWRDVAGYSKLAGADEERTLARLRAWYSARLAFIGRPDR